MADGTDGFGQVVEVMEASIVACEGRHIFRPRCKDEQRTMSASLETAALGFPGSRVLRLTEESEDDGDFCRQEGTATGGE